MTYSVPMPNNNPRMSDEMKEWFQYQKELLVGNFWVSVDYGFQYDSWWCNNAISCMIFTNKNDAAIFKICFG